MHDHDLDLIASLADGSLDDQTEARALLDTCPDCRQEYETQVSVISALSMFEPAQMTELEKAALHRDLWTELRNKPAQKVTATPWWYRLSYAAAGLLVVVGLVAVVNQLGGSGDSGDASTFVDAASGLDSGAEEPQPLDNTQGESTGTTLAATADAGAESTPDYKTLANETRLQQLPPANRASGSNDEEAECLRDAGLENQDVVGMVETDRTYIIAVPSNVDLDAETPVNFVDSTTCEVAHVEE